MDTEVLKFFADLSIDGLWIGLGVFLIVQAAKVCGLVKEDSQINPPRLALLSGLFFGLGWLTIEFSGTPEWSISVVISLLYRWIVGSLSAGLFYQIVLKPILTKIGVPAQFVTAQPSPPQG